MERKKLRYALGGAYIGVAPILGTSLCETFISLLEVWIINKLLFPGPPLVGLQVSEAMYFECVVDS